jgi:hypothetical protein
VWLGLIACAFLAVKRWARPLLFTIVWCGAVPCIVLVVYTWGYSLQGRYMITTVPAVCVLTAAGVVSVFDQYPANRLLRTAGRTLALLAVTLLAWLSLGTTAFTLIGPEHEDFRGTLHWIENVAEPSDGIVSAIWYSETVFSHYSPKLASRYKFQPPTGSVDVIAGQLEAGKRVWYLCRWGVPKEVNEYITKHGLSRFDFRGGGYADIVVLLWPHGDVPREEIRATARRTLERALGCAPLHPESTLLQLGTLAKEDPGCVPLPASWYFNEAARRLETLRRLAPTSLFNRKALGNAYAEAGQFPEAIAEVKAALALPMPSALREQMHKTLLTLMGRLIDQYACAGLVLEAQAVRQDAYAWSNDPAWLQPIGQKAGP